MDGIHQWIKHTVDLSDDHKTVFQGDASFTVVEKLNTSKYEQQQ